MKNTESEMNKMENIEHNEYDIFTKAEQCDFGLLKIPVIAKMAIVNKIKSKILVDATPMVSEFFSYFMDAFLNLKLIIVGNRTNAIGTTIIEFAESANVKLMMQSDSLQYKPDGKVITREHPFPVFVGTLAIECIGMIDDTRCFCVVYDKNWACVGTTLFHLIYKTEN